MSTHNIAFLILGITALILIGVGNVLTIRSIGIDERVAESEWLSRPDLKGIFVEVQPPMKKEIGIVIAIIGFLLMAVGSAFYAVGRKRSSWFGLLGLLTPIGLLFLAVLKDRN